MAHNIFKTKILFPFVCLLVACVLYSCDEDESTGEYKLTGNIENLIPEYCCGIEQTTTTGSDGKSYLVVTPKLEVEYNFEYWGLKIKEVNYYIDGEHVKRLTSSPFELMYATTDMGFGKHTVAAQITIGGEACNDVVRKDSADFNVSSAGTVTKTYARFYYDYNYVCKGETLHLTPRVIESRSSEGTQITQVEYYWDGQLKATLTESPFTWDYQVNEEAGTTHNIQANIQYKDGHNTSGSTSYYFSGYTIMEDDGCRYWWSRYLAGNENEYSSGETVQSVAKVCKGKNNTDTLLFKLYFDDKLIAESSTFPYEIDYKLTGQTVGTHTFKSEWKITRADGASYTISSKENIVIVP